MLFGISWVIWGLLVFEEDSSSRGLGVAREVMLARICHGHSGFREEWGKR